MAITSAAQLWRCHHRGQYTTFLAILNSYEEKALDRTLVADNKVDDVLISTLLPFCTFSLSHEH